MSRRPGLRCGGFSLLEMTLSLALGVVVVGAGVAQALVMIPMHAASTERRVTLRYAVRRERARRRREARPQGSMRELLSATYQPGHHGLNIIRSVSYHTV